MKAARILWIDAGAGAAGDMILGALVDLGVPLGVVREAAASLRLEGWTLSARRVSRASLAARQVRVRVAGTSKDDAHVHHGNPPRGHGRTRRAILGTLNRSGLAQPVRVRAVRAFERLFEAEAKVHGTAPDRVHLHEAGAVDALIDIVGVSAAVEHLAPDRIVVSPVTVGSGTVRAAHGLLPVPVPAVVELLRSVPVTGDPLRGERLTPTGAALLVTLADAWGPIPAMRPLASGVGAGSLDDPDRPNVVRAVVGEEAGEGASPRVAVLSATVDDAAPQVLAFAIERLLEAGALDATVAPLVMKKGRPGHCLTALARPEDLDAVAEVLLRETGSLGLRYRFESRIELERKHERVRTRFGPIRVKIGSRDGVEFQAWPEYEDCARAARRHAVPLKDVQRAALRARGRRGGA